MELAADILSWPFLISGVLFSIVGGIGLIRLPDLYSRMHAAGIVDTIGIALISIGLIIQAGASIVTVKLIIIVVFVFITSPTSTHALAKAALHGAVRPAVPRRRSETEQAKRGEDEAKRNEDEAKPSEEKAERSEDETKRSEDETKPSPDEATEAKDKTPS